MASDQQVHSRTILQTLLELQRQGITPAMSHLEKVEPDLASFVMESFSDLHEKLLSLGGSFKKTQRVQRAVELLTVVCIVALRQSHYELWESQMDERVRQLDPSAAPTALPQLQPPPTPDPDLNA
jgi:hypothetical protein